MADPPPPKASGSSLLSFLAPPAPARKTLAQPAAALPKSSPVKVAAPAPKPVLSPSPSAPGATLGWRGSASLLTGEALRALRELASVPVAAAGTEAAAAQRATPQQPSSTLAAGAATSAASVARVLSRLSDVDLPQPPHAGFGTTFTPCVAGLSLAPYIKSGLAVCSWHRILPGGADGALYQLLSPSELQPGGSYASLPTDGGLRLLCKVRTTAAGRALLRVEGLGAAVADSFGLAETPTLALPSAALAAAAVAAAAAFPACITASTLAGFAQGMAVSASVSEQCLCLASAADAAVTAKLTLTSLACEGDHGVSLSGKPLAGSEEAAAAEEAVAVGLSFEAPAAEGEGEGSSTTTTTSRDAFLALLHCALATEGQQQWLLREAAGETWCASAPAHEPPSDDEGEQDTGSSGSGSGSGGGGGSGNEPHLALGSLSFASPQPLSEQPSQPPSASAAATTTASSEDGTALRDAQARIAAFSRELSDAQAQGSAAATQARLLKARCAELEGLLAASRAGEATSRTAEARSRARAEEAAAQCLALQSSLQALQLQHSHSAAAASRVSASAAANAESAQASSAAHACALGSLQASQAAEAAAREEAASARLACAALSTERDDLRGALQALQGGLGAGEEARRRAEAECAGLRREVGEGGARVKELAGALAAAEGAAGALRERVAELERAVAASGGGGAAVAAAAAAGAAAEAGSGSGEAEGTPAAEGSTNSTTPAGGPSELFRQAADLREALEKERSERATAAKLAEGRRVELGRLAAELAKEAKGKKELGEKVVRLTGEKAAAEEQIAGLREQLSSRGGPAAAAATVAAAAAAPPPRTPSAPQQAAGSGASSAAAAAGGGSAAPTPTSALSPGPPAGGPGGEAFKALISGLTEENTTLKEKIDQYKATIRDLGRRITELEEGGRAAAAPVAVAVAVAAGGSGAGNPFGSASAAAAAPPPSSGNPF